MQGSFPRKTLEISGREVSVITIRWSHCGKRTNCLKDAWNFPVLYKIVRKLVVYLDQRSTVW